MKVENSSDCNFRLFDDVTVQMLFVKVRIIAVLFMFLICICSMLGLKANTDFDSFEHVTCIGRRREFHQTRRNLLRRPIMK